MGLQEFYEAIERKYKGSLVPVQEARRLEPHAKEYLYRLRRKGAVERASWGWYYIPDEARDPWEFLAKDKGKKVIIKQSASSIWSQDFVHRDIYHVAVEDSEYKRALESYFKSKGWKIEVEVYTPLSIPYKQVDGLRVQRPEACIVDCIADWAFLDATAVLFYSNPSLQEIRRRGRWRRISGSKVRVWQAVKYICQSFNDYLGERFPVRRRTRIEDPMIKSLLDEAVEKVMEFA